MANDELEEKVAKIIYGTEPPRDFEVENACAAYYMGRVGIESYVAAMDREFHYNQLTVSKRYQKHAVK